MQRNCFDRSRIDTHEILKKIIFDGMTPDKLSSSKSKSTTKKIQMLNDKKNHGFKSYEFYFDSLNKDASSELSNGEIKWSITNLNNFSSIKDCVQVNITPLFFPKIVSNSAKPDFYYYRTVFAKIGGLSDIQSVIGVNNNSFHFMFRVDNPNSVAITLTPIKDTFTFQQPINSLDELSLVFMKPHNYQKINIPADKITVKSVANSNPARFTIEGLDETWIIGPTGVLTTPVAVYMSGFKTTNSTINNVINTTEGNYITNVIDNKTFEINGIDLTGINENYAEMIIPKNRIAFSMQFITISDSPTNYISVMH